MTITEVKVFPLQKQNEKLRAYATMFSIIVLLLRDLKIIEGLKGLFVSMPSRRRKDGTFRDIIHPLNTETRKMIEDSIISEYNNVKTLEVD